MTQNELMHNVDGANKKEGIVSVGTVKIVTLIVDGKGNIAINDQFANVGDTIVIEADNLLSPYPGSINALIWNGTSWTNACNQLVGWDYMTVAQTYTIQKEALNNTFSFEASTMDGTPRTSAMTNARPRPRPAGANGTLRVGSGSPPVDPSPHAPPSLAPQR